MLYNWTHQISQYCIYISKTLIMEKREDFDT